MLNTSVRMRRCCTPPLTCHAGPVVCLQGSILRSQVIPNLTPPTIVTYSQSSGENTFLVAGVPDQQFTLDSSSDLSNWTTGPLLDLIYGSGTLVFIIPEATNAPAAQYYRATLVPSPSFAARSVEEQLSSNSV